eukprot:1142372-Pelagomonas_calceolata.AAC.3
MSASAMLSRPGSLTNARGKHGLWCCLRHTVLCLVTGGWLCPLFSSSISSFAKPPPPLYLPCSSGWGVRRLLDQSLFN